MAIAWDVREAPLLQAPLPGQPDEPYTGTRRRFALVNRPMAVRASVRFFDPVNVEYSRTYDTSRDFEPSSAICSSLLNRLEHCSTELITRKDAAALEPGPGKSPRFEMAFQLTNAPYPVTEKVFRSYQSKPATMDQATEVILSTDRMIGLFFMRHDKDFKWSSGPVKEGVSGRPKTAKPASGGPESLDCVPRCRFFPSSQTYEFVPGYEIELAFTSNCSTRRPQTLSKTIRLSSSQCSPLNLASGEELLSAATRAVNASIDSRKRALIGFRWLSAMNDTLSIDLRIKNNLGPDHEHLTYKLDTKQSLFNSPNGLDCIMFLDEVYRSLSRIRDRVDDAICATHELEVKVLELRGAKWEAAEPLSVFLDSTISYSRRTVEAILDRVQTGVASVLLGKDNSITLSILHRGHLVLDKVLVAHEDPSVPQRPSLTTTPEHEGNVIITQLAQRIQFDISTVCKDTCTLDSRGDALPNLHMVQRSHATRLPELDRAETPPLQTAPRQPMVYTPPPSSHSNAPRRDTLSGKGSGVLRRSSSLSGPPPRTPNSSMRRPRHGDMDLTPPATPSLVDDDVETPRHSMIITPPPDVRRNRGLSEVSGYEPRIVDDDASANDPIVRDFAHLASHVEPLSKEYRSQRSASISKSDRRFGGSLVPDSPTPARSTVVIPEAEEEGVRDSPPKAVIPVWGLAAKDEEPGRDETPPTTNVPAGEDEDLFCTPSKAAITAQDTVAEEKEPAQGMVSETVREDTPADDDNTHKSELPASPILEGWLEYRCDPLDPPATSSEQPPLTDSDRASLEPETTSEPALEGWLEYSCEPLDAIVEKQELAVGTDLPLEGWLEYRCEPLDEEDDGLLETIPVESESTGSPVLEGWLEYWCEPLDPEEESSKVTSDPSLEEMQASPIVVTEEKNDIDNDQTSLRDSCTLAGTGSPPSLLMGSSGSESGSEYGNELAYTVIGKELSKQLSKDLLKEVPLPSATTAVFDAPEVVAVESLPVVSEKLLDSDREVESPEGKEDGVGALDTEDKGLSGSDATEGRSLEVHEAVLEESLAGTQEKEALQVVLDPITLDQEQAEKPSHAVVQDLMISDQKKDELPQVDLKDTITSETTHELDADQVHPPTPDDETLPGFFQDEAADKGKGVAFELDTCEPGESSPRPEEAELARAVAEIDAAIEKPRDVGQSKDATAQGGVSSEVEDEIARAVAEINAAVEKSQEAGQPEEIQQSDEAEEITCAVADIDPTIEKPREADQSKDAVDPEVEEEIAAAVAEINTAVETLQEAGQSKGAVDPEVEEEIAQAVAEINAAVERSHKDGTAEVQESSEIDDEISQAVAEIDATIDKFQAAEESNTTAEVDNEIALAVAEINAVVEKHAAKQLAEGDKLLHETTPEVDSEIALAVAEINAAVEKHAAKQLAEDDKPLHETTPEVDSEIALAVAEINAAVEKHAAKQLAEDDKPLYETTPEVDNEIALAVAEINAAVERANRVEELFPAPLEEDGSLTDDDDNYNLSSAVTEIDAAVEETRERGESPELLQKHSLQHDDDVDISSAVAAIDAAADKAAREFPGKHASPVDDVDISRAIAEIDAAVGSMETASRESKARKILETALREKNSLEIARAIVDIDIAVEKRKAEQEAKDRLAIEDAPRPLGRAQTFNALDIRKTRNRLNLEDTPQALKRASTSDFVAPPRPRRSVTLGSQRPESLILKPTPFQSFPSLRMTPFPPSDRPRTAVPFSGPSLTRKASVPTAGYLGLHNDYLFPLQDALLGTHSKGGFFGASSSRASPILSPTTTECRSGLPEMSGAVAPIEEVETESAETAEYKPPLPERPRATEETETDDEEWVKVDRPTETKAREETPPASPKTGYGVLPGFMFWAAGVTIASSVFKRA